MNKSRNVIENMVCDSNGKTYMTEVFIFGSGEMGRESGPNNNSKLKS